MYYIDISMFLAECILDNEMRKSDEVVATRGREIAGFCRFEQTLCRSGDLNQPTSIDIRCFARGHLRDYADKG